MKGLISRIFNKLKILRSIFAFSNCAELVTSKLFHRNSNVLVYRYKQFRLVSFESYTDGVSIQECLAEKVYEKALQESKPKGRIGNYINLGANIGAFDVAIFDAWGMETQGIAVEMNPWTFARLASNIYYNKLSTRPLHAAVLDQSGTASISIENSGQGQSLYHSVGSNPTSEVKTLTLSQAASILSRYIRRRP